MIRRYVLRFGVVELVDDHDVVRIGRDVVDSVGGQRLHAGEDMTPPFRPGTADVKLAEAWIRQDFPIGSERLLQDLFPMRHEEKRRVLSAGLGTQVAIVQGRDHGLARAGGSHHEIAMAIVDRALRVDRVQHLLLVRVRTNLKAGQRQRDSVRRPTARRFEKGIIEPIAVARSGSYRSNSAGVPIGVERRFELLKQRRRALVRQPHIPLDAVE